MIALRRSLIMLVTSVVLVSAFMPVITHAAGGTLTTTIIPANCRGANAATACGVCDLADLAKNIVSFLVFFFVVYSSIRFTIAGCKYLFAGGNAYAANIAKETFFHVFGGLLLVLLAWAIINLVMSALLSHGVSGALPWNHLCS
jgi:hypothetical protein